MFNLAVAEKIQDIKVVGNQRIEKETIISNLGLSIGDRFSSEGQSQALKQLYATGFFKDISLSFTSGKLLINVQEAPFISKVRFIGNSKLSEQILLKEIALQIGDALTDVKLQGDLTKLQELYKRNGYFSTIIRSQVENLENNRVVLTFKINEGSKTYVKKIVFIGNENYSDSELKSIILTKEKHWLRFLDPNTTYDPDRINYDKELLKEFYQAHAFVDCEILSTTAELAPAKDYFIITYVLEEGSRYYIGNIKFQNNIANLNDKEFAKYLYVKPKSLVNVSELEKIAEKISKKLVEKGFYQVNVYPNISKRHDQKLVDVTFTIDRAEKVYTRRIEIVGNVKTDDSVIRREIPLSEGDTLDKLKLQRAEQNLRNLDFFEHVRLRPVLADGGAFGSDNYDVIVEVEEKSTSAVNLDLGYSTSDGAFGKISFKERNLIGTGRELDVGIFRSSRLMSYYFNIEDPHFMGKDFSLGTNFFNTTTLNKNKGFLGILGKKSDIAKDDQYKSDSKGVGIIFGYMISENLRHDINYTIKFDRLTVPNDSRLRLIKSEQGKFTYSIIGHTITYNQLDSLIVPKDGYISIISQEYAGVGGNVKYFKNEFETKFYKSFFNNKLTFRLSGSVGHIQNIGGQNIRIRDRFTIGEDQLRGFESNGIGPRDKSELEPLGGKKYYAGTAELMFPIGAPKELNIIGSAFTDIGGLWDVDLPKNSSFSKDDIYNDKIPRVSVGIGLTLITRIAPIRIDYAIPVKKQPYDNTQRIHIRMSTNL